MNINDVYKNENNINKLKNIFLNDNINSTNSNQQNYLISLADVIDFTKLINELDHSPTISTFIQMIELIKKPSMHNYGNAIDENQLKQILNFVITNQNDLNLKQSAFFVIAKIMKYCPYTISIFYKLGIVKILNDELMNGNSEYISSVFNVITQMIRYCESSRPYFFNSFLLNNLFQAAYKNILSNNSYLIVKFFVTVVECVEITEIEQVNTIMNLFKLIFGLKQAPLNLNSNVLKTEKIHSNALYGTIKLLQNQNIPGDQRKEAAQFLNIFIQFYLQENGLTSEKIYAVNLASQLFILNACPDNSIHNILPRILSLFKLFYLDSNYFYIAQSLVTIIEYCNDNVLIYLLNDLNTINVILEVFSRSDIKTKQYVYLCLHAIFHRMPKQFYPNYVNNDLFDALFNIIETKQDFVIDIINDIIEFITIFEELGIIDTITQIFNSIDAHNRILMLLQEDTYLNENIGIHLNHLNEKLSAINQCS